jgi:hypothetical protein
MLGPREFFYRAPDLLALLRSLSQHPRARLRYELLEERTFFPPGAGNGFLVSIRSRKSAQGG